ncbi:MAG: hypothetical protein IKC46_05530 [Lachnospiraceae bacterium]|nr:hypothetical protein [Lachnospiraceae bacterium]
MTILQKIISKKEQELQKAPEGTLNINVCKGNIQYYLNHHGKRTYIREKNQKLIHQLCQKDYDEKVLRTAQKELEQLQKVSRFYQETGQGTECEAIYEMLDERRKKHVQPIWLPDEEFVKQWENVEYEKKGFREDAPEFYSEKGERMRSKSELLIANILYRHGIPYRYEYPLYLNGYGQIHPDFTVLDVKQRKEIYFEHFGMMDDESYQEEALRRILAYEKNGIFRGDRLLFTFETSKMPINSRVLEEMILNNLK